MKKLMVTAIIAGTLIAPAAQADMLICKTKLTGLSIESGPTGLLKFKARVTNFLYGKGTCNISASGGHLAEVRAKR